MDILLTFTGFQDPYTMGLVDKEEQSGPILSLVGEKSFDKIILFSTPRTDKNTSATREALQASYKNLDIEVINLVIQDPTDYFAILKKLRLSVRNICDATPQANFFISVTSGTPQMHACWILLAASGEIPAYILNVRPPQFVSKDLPLITEVDLASTDFPTVRSKVTEIQISDNNILDIEIAITQLEIVGDHPLMRKALEMGAALAPSAAPIFLLGETGTGKELFARFVHRLGGRPIDCFVPLNCAAIPKDLVESMLFGHKKGAFAGAISEQTGKFDQADGGTLFLDEIGELPVSIQAKLLRVLEDGLVEPLGDKRPHKVNVRIIAATNKDLGRAIRDGQFREDLYYRLNIGEILIPPLRERRSDIPKISLHILDKVNRSLRKPKRLSTAALTRLQNHSWPGNVRDLENVIERSARLARQEVLDADDLMISEPVTYADPLAALPEPSKNFSLEQYISSARKQLVLRAVELANGNQSEAGRLLGISPQAIHKFLRKIE
jgi:transcriptional regulator with PAS, ATPase and Fis domain